MHTSRRSFIQQTGLIAAGMMLPGALAAMTGNKALPKKIGLQLYTLREQLAKDPKGTLAKVAGIGYKEVETFYGFQGADDKGEFWGLKPAELNAVLKQHQLSTPSGHYQLNDYLTKGNGNADALQPQIDLAAALGQQYFIVPVLPLSLWDKKLGADDYKFMAEQLNKAGEQCKKANLKIGYHNHYWEFKPLADSNSTGYEIMLKETDPALVAFELDLFWAVKSGRDPITLFKEAPGRFVAWHVKDMDKANTASLTASGTENKTSMELLSGVTFAEVGTGSINFSKIFAQAKLAGVKHLFVEQDKITIDPFDSVTQSYKYVKNVLLK
ncbi:MULTISPECIES: sugar phosphate isomerase/epimerase family protein [Chitinophaga]|uniref:sugar phosphate isomerase/epimerase family protein n=1 Tax=Chitinophaga TaxID=79328 RepID=UPI000DB9B933|nr:sugar phosphate isomerase/epimerase [Chitinophaga ginsengisegetis]MDR6567223.1 sugar phosphate isomerase/epimerase [Chitinophaga ginsengisegetis]MDR6646953.1 sugar phosphate isomerase/epimerase [Chitinophaga ginsengisegetis]MDR6653303.1 sugar phosphate isomerase/epimerase [Chitinophaga ginsengisegetis]